MLIDWQSQVWYDRKSKHCKPVNERPRQRGIRVQGIRGKFIRGRDVQIYAYGNQLSGEQLSGDEFTQCHLQTQGILNGKMQQWLRNIYLLYSLKWCWCKVYLGIKSKKFTWILPKTYRLFGLSFFFLQILVINLNHANLS